MIAGEKSADMLMAPLAQQLKTTDPSCRIIGIGGQHLKGCVDEFLLDITHTSAIGIQGMLQQWSTLRRFYRILKQSVSETHIDRVILADFQHQNIRIAKILAQKAIPIISFITPNFWIWGSQKQAQKVIDISDKIIAIFEQEYQFYKQLCDKVMYCGHPLADILPPKANIESIHKQGPLIALFPGSRQQEIQFYLSAMLDAIPKLRADNAHYRFVLVLSDPYFSHQIQKRVTQKGVQVEIHEGKSPEILANADCVICASGTVTLEAIFYETPMVVLAALSKVSYWVAKYILRIKLPYVSLPNILAGKEVVKELVQAEISADRIAHEVRQCLSDDQKAIKLTAAHQLSQHLFKEPFVYQNIVELLMSESS